MKHRQSDLNSLFTFAGLACLVVGGVTLRLAFQHLPNVAPVAAIALFAGYVFRSRLLALLAPLSVMAISDLWLGSYQWQLMIAVYVMLTLPVVLRGILRSRLRIKGKLRDVVSALAGLVGCCVLSSLLFFVVTNFVTWMTSPWYDQTLAGLSRCFIQAIPFFRFTLFGDLAFGIVLFGGYALAKVAVTHTARRRAVVG